MNIIQKLDNALESMNIPFYPGFYAGTGEEYGTYTELSDEPDMFCDNLPEYEIISGVVNLFVKSEQQTKKNQCKKLLRQAGFTVQTTYEQHEFDTGYTHFSIEFETYNYLKEE